MTGRRTIGRGALNRRRLLALLGASAGAAALPHAAFAAARGARTTRAQTKTSLYYSVAGYAYDSGQNSPDYRVVTEALREYFLPKNPGIDLRVDFAYSGNTSLIMASMLAGTAPDVFEAWTGLTTMVNQGLLIDLSPYIQQSNIDLGIFLKGEIDAHTALNATGVRGLYALPAYVHQLAMNVNLGLLDQLGLAYPSENWDYNEAAKLWQAAAGTVPNKTTRRYGANLVWDAGGPVEHYLRGWGGSYVDPTNPARTWITSPGSLAAANWLFNLIDNNVATNQFNPYDNQGFTTEQVVCQWSGSDTELPPTAAELRNMKWRYYPMPRWPQGSFTTVYNDYHAAWSGTKHPEAAWSLINFLATNRDWQLALIKGFLVGPALNSLWPAWLQTVYQYAPPLRDHNLEVFVQQVDENTPIGDQRFFRYGSDQAYSLINNYTNKAMAKQLSITEAWTEAARQVNAFESTQAQTATQGRATQASLARLLASAEAHPSTTTFPEPNAGVTTNPVTSKDSPAKNSAGSWVLQGVGSGLGGVVDGETFAGKPWIHATGEFTVRLTSIANVDAPNMVSGAAAGLMVRSSLATSAPNVSLAVTLDRGVRLKSRPFAGVGEGDQGPGVFEPGLLASADILYPSSNKQANYLMKPVWLRFVQSVNHWTGYTSLDGTTWTQAGSGVAIEAAGAWIGIFVTPHAAWLSDKPYKIAATFDNMNFTPLTWVNVGSP